MTRPVRIRVPGTTSNLGPGFDTLGIALQTYNEIVVSRAHAEGAVTSAGRPIDSGGQEMVRSAAAQFFTRTGVKPFAFDARLSGDVPIARGLGSSVTVRLGVVAGLNKLTRARLNSAQLLRIVAELEHHPDNAAPAIFGGFAIAGMVGGESRCLHFPVSRAVRFVALIPDFEISTAAARRLVPDTFSKQDTVHSLNRVAFISAAFASADYEALRGVFDDRIHQPYREKLLPQLSAIIRAGEAAGAIGGWLSGSGSTVMCLAKARAAKAVGTAMQQQLPRSEVCILAADNDGLKIF